MKPRIFLFVIFSLCLQGAIKAVAEETRLLPPISEVGIGSTEDPPAEGMASSVLVGGNETDWELYMLRLVNRARQDPAGEAARIGSAVTDTRVPVSPLAYDLLVGETARNHTVWMHDNLGNISSGQVPDSFAHYETLNGQSSGVAASGTPSFTGVSPGNRLNFVGFSWNSVGENILVGWSGSPYVINRARIDSGHRGWWESTGHRNNMLSANFTGFGYYVEARSFIPPRGGLVAPADNIIFSAQCFGRPQSTPRVYLFGVIYADRDDDGSWTPRDVGDPLREGLMNVSYDVFPDGSSTAVASGVTFGNGAFSVHLAPGVYDVVFTESFLPGGQLRIENASMTDINLDIGDHQVSLGNPLTILGSSPPSGYVDPLEDRDATTGVLLGTKDISITFSSPVTNVGGGILSLSNFERKYFRNSIEVSASSADLATAVSPTVTLVSGSGAGPYTLRFSPRLPLGAWTQVTAINVVDVNGNPLSNTENKVVVALLPMDLTQNGAVLGDDINRWLAINDGTFSPAPLTPQYFLDQKRNGVILGEDIARAIQLINGIGTFRVWSGFSIGPPP